ncbi:tetratricopeptide repeat protein [Zavarzinia aquatilis]|nr:tetratricopeptide repeat protein [Zavarzinia aquatilis]
MPSVAATLDYTAGKAAVEAKDWPMAIRRLTAAVRADPGNADAENLLGFAYRKSGDYEAAQKHYWRALKLDPDHRGAREYLGESFLEMKMLPKAEEQLSQLVRLCPAGCDERSDLEAAIQRYRQENP